MTTKKGLPRVWEVAEPHQDISGGDLDPARFVASLNRVETGDAAADYAEAERFFQKTYMTRSLTLLMEGVLRRLSGGDSAPIRQLQTPFGGGKTHTLVTVYHTFKHPEAADAALKDVLRTVGLSQVPRGVKVAVLDGVALDVQGRRAPEDFEIRTLWGELAYRLGGRALYQLVARSDDERTTPGTDILRSLLEKAAPAVVLIDEFVAYLVKSRGVRVGRGDLAEQSLVFLQELTTAVADVSRTMLFLTLPYSSLEVATTRAEDAQALLDRASAVASHLAGRFQLVETPVAGDEVFGVLKSRLFSSTGTEREARRVAQAFRRYYEAYSRSFPESVKEKDYEDRIVQAYPFHPELIDLLYHRWGPHPRFQRTRGALRLLAMVLRNQWQKRPGSSLLVQPWAIDLSDRLIEGDVIQLPGSEYRPVVTADVLDKGFALDHELGGEYYRERLATGTATCAFLYTITGASEETGATEEQLRLALLRPDINPALVSEVLGRMRDRFWFLVYRDRRYRFQTRPNLNKVVMDFEGGVSEEDIAKEILTQLEAVSGRGKTSFRVHCAPKEARDVEDRPEPALVLLPPDTTDDRQAENFMKEYLKPGRTNRNALVFVAPEPGGISEAKVRCRRLLALTTLQSSGQYKSLEDEDKKEVDAKLRQARGDLRDSLLRAYARIYRPQAPDGLQAVQSSLKDIFRNGTLAERVWQVLKHEGQLLEGKVDAQYIKDKVWTQGEEVKVEAIFSAFATQPGLPLVESREAVAQGLVEGISKGEFGLLQQQDGKAVLRFREAPSIYEVMSAEGTLVARQKAEQMAVGQGTEKSGEEGDGKSTKEKRVTVLTVYTSTAMTYPITQLLTMLNQRQVPGNLTVKLDAPEGLPDQVREELERLLKDYMVQHTWEDTK